MRSVKQSYHASLRAAFPPSHELLEFNLKAMTKKWEVENEAEGRKTTRINTRKQQSQKNKNDRNKAARSKTFPFPSVSKVCSVVSSSCTFESENGETNDVNTRDQTFVL